jgi:hypothetical protein
MLEENDDIKKELAELAPGFPAKPTYEPPAGYFDKLPDHMTGQWRLHDRKRLRIVQIRRIAAIAALVSGCLVGLFCWMQKTDASEPLQGISGADAFAYINENISEFDHLIETETIDIPTSENFQLPASDAEQYLLEELDATELEQLF